MDKFRACISYLKCPELVAHVQKYFGIKHNVSSDNGIILTNLENDQVETNNTVVQNNNNIDQYITNWFWYYFFLFFTYFGDEHGYSIIIPFLIWNIDSGVARKMVLVWAVTMYIGQCIKDIIRWPRPESPVIRMQTKWAFEYGMPSTHAMISIAMPFSVLYYISNQYQINFNIGISIVFLLSILISLSRLYLGMHSVLDLIVGILLVSILLIPFLPLADIFDHYLMHSKWAPFLLIIVTVTLIIIYPTGEQCKTAKGDTTLILATCAGILTGGWFNVELNLQNNGHNDSKNNPIVWLSFHDIGGILIRSGLGYLCIVLLFLISKYVLCAVDVILRKFGFKVMNDELKKHTPVLDIIYNYLTFYLVSFNIMVSIPVLQKLFNVQRQSFSHEAS